ncbi:unnamed protein product [Albugo candida]|uniref:Uncharacterized protein n=1 Tax=Albugo candida TaxID=65357 RepID=A0A024FT73_9STRA|nr:unnamed protein product [Albugo candida]|eukprot:CCI10196.1 unnamed protein product [Albugo candida]
MVLRGLHKTNESYEAFTFSNTLAMLRLRKNLFINIAGSTNEKRKCVGRILKNVKVDCLGSCGKQRF